MSRQVPLKYILPALLLLLGFLVAAWAFNLPPVSALTDRANEPLQLTLQSNGQVTGFRTTWCRYPVMARPPTPLIWPN